LLFAVKNDDRLNTYKVYSYYAENLQDDLELATEIIQVEPELIEDTPVSNNRQFILDNVDEVPEIVKYISSTLKSDVEFVSDLCELNDPNIVGEITKDFEISSTIMQNEELRENRQFMSMAISEDVNNIKFANDNLKSDYMFIKQVCEENSDVIEYVADNTVEFGIKGLKAAEEVAMDNSSKKAIEDFEEESKKIKEKIQEGSNSDELEELLKRDKQLERHAQFFRDIRDGKHDPVRAARLINVVCKNLDEDYKKKLEQILKIDEAIIQKEKQEKEAQENQPIGEQDKQEEQENIDKKIGVEDVEKTTENAQLDEMNEETKIIREDFIQNKLEKEEEKTYE